MGSVRNSSTNYCAPFFTIVRASGVDCPVPVCVCPVSYSFVHIDHRAPLQYKSSFIQDTVHEHTVTHSAQGHDSSERNTTAQTSTSAEMYMSAAVCAAARTQDG